MWPFKKRRHEPAPPNPVYALFDSIKPGDTVVIADISCKVLWIGTELMGVIYRDAKGILREHEFSAREAYALWGTQV